MGPKENIRAKIKRRWSMKEKNIPPDDFSDADDETTSHVTAQIADAEKQGHDQGKPGSLLNRLIQHGNRKTEEQMRREMEAAQHKQREAEGGK